MEKITLYRRDFKNHADDPNYSMFNDVLKDLGIDSADHESIEEVEVTVTAVKYKV